EKGNSSRRPADGRRHSGHCRPGRTLGAARGHFRQGPGAAGRQGAGGLLPQGRLRGIDDFLRRQREWRQGQQPPARALFRPGRRARHPHLFGFERNQGRASHGGRGRRDLFRQMRHRHGHHGRPPEPRPVGRADVPGHVKEAQAGERRHPRQRRGDCRRRSGV
ncbi:MAG: hypothetical protein AVDCRST_MAG91-1640, partial [uncultured Sphingomonadaceae bacterium]